jgi:putative spermidine/putrescine transport system substrate-binding protein
MPATATTPVRLVVALAAVTLLASACGGTTSPRPSEAASPSPSSGAAESPSPIIDDALAPLVAAAEKEGSLSVIALPHDWCNYGEALDTFTSRYEITLNELNPDAGFADQIAAIQANRDKGPEAPDVIDVAPSFAAQAKAAKLLAPYKVSTWDTIPDVAKDPAGAWTGDYYGVLAFETNTTTGTTPPTDWVDLLDPARSTQLALPGDPRVSGQAIETVYAAALANGGSLANAQAGLDYFAKLKKAGHLSTTIAQPDTIDDGTTPLTVRWTYNALAHRDRTDGTPAIDVTVPEKGRLGGYYAQAISAFAPHPNAARLWLEFLYSDEGQNIWLKGNCHPIRFDDLTARDAIPPDVLASLPDTAGTVFPTLDQLNKASDLITNKWNAVVGVDIR